MLAPAIIVVGLTAVFVVSAVLIVVSGIGRPEEPTLTRADAESATAATTEDAFMRYERRKAKRGPVEQTHIDRPQVKRSQVDRTQIEPPQAEGLQVERPQVERPQIERPQIERPQAGLTTFTFKRVERGQVKPRQVEPSQVEPRQSELTLIDSEQVEADDVLAQANADTTPGQPRPGQLEDPGPIRFYTGGWRTDFGITSVPFTDIRGGGPPKDGIPAIDHPVYESIEAASEWLDGQAPVIALEVGGEARAYPMAIMTWHEIVNDTLGDTDVAVTFCPLCNTALAFERTLDGVVLDFGTSGNLYLSNLVMYDRQTETWWYQAGGEAIVGEQMGAQLEVLPAQIISLDDFHATWPDGNVLSRETGSERPYGTNPYPGYDRADEAPWNFDGTTDGRIAPKERVATAGDGDQAIAFAYPDLASVGVATETIDGEPIVAFWVSGTRSALDQKVIDESQDIGSTGIFSPIVDGRELTFERLGPPGTPITDRETGSSWSITGVATEGKLAGTRLKPIVSADHLWFSWAAFNPETRIWQLPATG